MSAPDLLVVDGNSIAHRAYHAYSSPEAGEITSRSGHPRWATYGFFQILAKLVDRTGCGRVLVGFDDADRNWRKERHPAYKAQRPDKAEALIVQLRDIVTLSRQIGLPVGTVDGFEADDVLGSAAAAATAAGVETVITTSDKDSFQLVGPGVSLLRVTSKIQDEVLMGVAEVEASCGVTPDRYVELAALRGDASDNLPGVDGIGPKIAGKLLSEVNLWAVLDAPEIAKPHLGKKAYETLVDQLDRVRLNLELMTIARDLHVDVVAPLELDSTHMANTFREWDLHSLIPKVVPTLCSTPTTNTLTTRATSARRTTEPAASTAHDAAQLDLPF